MSKPYAYSVSNINAYEDVVYGGFNVFPNLKEVIRFLKKEAVFPYELLETNFKYNIEYHAEYSQRNNVIVSDLIEKIELSQKDLDKIEKLVEESICKQEESDRKFSEENPGQYLPRFSGVFVVNRKDKQKYIDGRILQLSWIWKDLE